MPSAGVYRRASPCSQPMGHQPGGSENKKPKMEQRPLQARLEVFPSLPLEGVCVCVQIKRQPWVPALALHLVRDKVSLVARL